jgi:hypothetical protein
MSYSDANDAYTRYRSPYYSYPQPTEATDARYAIPAPYQKGRQPASPAPRPRQSPPAEKRMAKAEALSLVQKLKRWIVVAAVVAFGVIGALALGHTTGVTAQSNSSTPQQTTPASSSEDGNFFQQQGGYQFGSGSSSQAPVTTSRTS